MQKIKDIGLRLLEDINAFIPAGREGLARQDQGRRRR